MLSKTNNLHYVAFKVIEKSFFFVAGHSRADEKKSGNKYRTSKLLIRSSWIKLIIVEEVLIFYNIVFGSPCDSTGCLRRPSKLTTSYMENLLGRITFVNVNRFEKWLAWSNARLEIKKKYAYSNRLSHLRQKLFEFKN